MKDIDWGTEESFVVMYRLTHGLDWFIAGDINGYRTLEEARRIGEIEKQKPPRREFGGTRMVRVEEVVYGKRTISLTPVQ